MLKFPRTPAQIFSLGPLARLPLFHFTRLERMMRQTCAPGAQNYKVPYIHQNLHLGAQTCVHHKTFKIKIFLALYLLKYPPPPPAVTSVFVWVNSCFCLMCRFMQLKCCKGNHPKHAYTWVYSRRK